MTEVIRLLDRKLLAQCQDWLLTTLRPGKPLMFDKLTGMSKFRPYVLEASIDSLIDAEQALTFYTASRTNPRKYISLIHGFDFKGEMLQLTCSERIAYKLKLKKQVITQDVMVKRDQERETILREAQSLAVTKSFAAEDAKRKRQSLTFLNRLLGEWRNTASTCHSQIETQSMNRPEWERKAYIASEISKLKERRTNHFERYKATTGFDLPKFFYQDYFGEPVLT